MRLPRVLLAGAGLLLLLAVVAFWPHDLSRRWAAIDAYTHMHARFMVSTALLLVDPVLARLMSFHLPRQPCEQLCQGINFSLIALARLFLWRTLPAGVAGRIAFRNFCVGTVAVLMLFFVLPHTGAWAAFALWFRVLPLT